MIRLRVSNDSKCCKKDTRNNKETTNYIDKKLADKLHLFYKKVRITVLLEY